MTYKPFDDIDTWYELCDFLRNYSGRVFIVYKLFKLRTEDLFEVDKQYIINKKMTRIDGTINCYLDSDGNVILGDIW